MIPNVVKFLRRIRTGEYEHDEYAVEATLEKGDSVEECLNEIRGDVEKSIATGAVESMADSSASEVTDEPVTVTPGKGKKGKKGKKDKEETNPDEETEEDEESEESEDEDEEESEDDEESEDEDEESESDDEEEEEEKTPPKKEKKGGKKKKPQVYSRKSEAHKEIFSKLLREVAPKWKKETPSLGADASREMEGEEFLDEDGNVLDSFRDKVKKSMKVKK